jgi:hypothetical protein
MREDLLDVQAISEPWDLPPPPEVGDATPEPTFAAVGRALTEWEWVEFMLANLKAVLNGKSPRMLRHFREYGTDRNIFALRMDGLEEVARAFFVKRPDQTLESDFKNLARKVRKFSARRNDIAHGIVRANPKFPWRLKENGDTDVEFFLFPAHYDPRRFSHQMFPDYILSSLEIHRFADHFAALKLEVHAYTERVSPGQRPP